MPSTLGFFLTRIHHWSAFYLICEIVRRNITFIFIFLIGQHQIFPNLEELSVDVKHITTKRHFPEDFLCNLKCLDLFFFAESTSILSLDDFFQRMHTMKVLKIEEGECIGLSNKKIENGMSAIIRKGNKCRDLKHIIKQESFNIDNLAHLQVRWCHNLISLVPSLTSLQNLTTLKVWSSKGLVNIFNILNSKESGTTENNGDR